MNNILTVDVEELHHRLAYSDECKTRGLNFQGSALVGVIKILKLLKKYNHTATFFIIGEILEKHPDIAKIIIKNNHEIGNHTYEHKELKQFTDVDEFAHSIDKTDKLILDAAGVNCIGFRAPRWNLPNNINDFMEVLRDRGYKYDSSLFPANIILYGNNRSIPNCYKMNKCSYYEEDVKSNFFEIPTSVYVNNVIRFPTKFRLSSSKIQEKVIQNMNVRGHPAVLTLHSWEFLKLPKSFRELGNPVKNFVRNYRIPFTRHFESLLSRYSFVSVVKYLSALEEN